MSFKPKYANLVDVYARSVERFAARPLFGVKQGGEWRWMTYRDFGEKVDRTRAGLAALGIAAGDRVAVIANNRPEWAIAAYATYGLGAAYVPMYEAQHDKDWKFILDDCNAKAVFVASAQIRDRINGLKAELPDLQHVIVFDGGGEGSLAQLQTRGEPVEALRPDPESIAGFIYTSGTTGNPKGVLLTHRNLASNVSAVHSIFPMSEEDRSLSFLPWAHSFGQVVELHALLSMGASLGIAEAVDKIVANLAEVQPTLLFSVPRIFNRIYDGLHKKMAEEGGFKKKMFDAAVANETLRRELAAQKRSSGLADFKHRIFDKLVFSKVRARFGGRLKYAFSGGAAISREVAEFIDGLGITVYEGYGLTETSPIATCNWLGSRKIGSVGRAIPGVRIEIDRKVTGDPVNGEIIVHGHNVMKGYHKLPEENAQVFTADGGFRTGDMGRLDEEGFLYITGRIKEQYKLENGKYVVPSPLEEHLKLSPFISNVMVFGDNRPFNVALIVPDTDSLGRWARTNGIGSNGDELLSNPKVKELFRGQLEEFSAEFKQFEKIRQFVLVGEDFTTENDMMTPTLKLKRRNVIERYGATIDSLYSA